MNFQISKHALEQAIERGMTEQTIWEILADPEQIGDDESGEEGQKVFQKRIISSENKTYLVRVFVNMNKNPPVVKTVYKTSKITKYINES
jgi:hypothetical protein